MSTIVLELPDKHIQILERAAQERDVSIDQIVTELVDTIVTQEQAPSTYDVTQDSLYLIRAHDSTTSADPR
ncbi:MAG TPA: hypothetical protein VGD69_00810 [Herpetosiphonaceae bacterium]